MLELSKYYTSNVFLCQKCNKIQPPKQVNEFKLLGISEKFDLDLEELEDAYLKLQQLFHPDKYSQLSEKEIKYSTLLSSMINEAYQKLNSSISRATVLLQLNGINSHPEDSSFNDSQVLEEIMEIQNEFLEAEDSEQKRYQFKNLTQELQKQLMIYQYHLKNKIMKLPKN